MQSRIALPSERSQEKMRHATTKWMLLPTLSLSLSLATCGGDSVAGRNCAQDTDCGEGGHCVGDPDGVCSVPASAPCSAYGSRAECPGGSRCWKTVGGEYYCFADCNATCGGNGGCDSDGVCVPMSSLPEGGGGGGTGTSCSCHCRCSSCTGDTTVTCSSPSTQCGSCAVVCRQTCATSSGCGSYLSSSGSCS